MWTEAHLQPALDDLPSHKIKITLSLGNSRISKTSFSDDLVFMVLQKSGTLNQTHGNEYIHVKLFVHMCAGTHQHKHTLCDTL